MTKGIKHFKSKERSHVITMPEYANLDNYSFDLGKLEESSDLIIKNRKREAEQLDSEDDGPEDFTLNMEKWMRGTGPYKQGEGPAKDKEDDDHDAQEESEFLPQDSSTPTPARSKSASVEKPAATPIRTRNVTVEDAADVETPMRLPTPKLQRLNTETKQERAAEEVFDRIAALQAEVERLRDESEKRLAASKQLEAKTAQMQSDNQKLYTRLQDTDDIMRDLRAENEERSAANKRLLEDKAKSQTDKQKLHDRLQDANGLVKELQTENEERIASGKEFEEENEQVQADNQKLYDRLQQTSEEVDSLRSEKEEHSAASKRLQEENARLRAESHQRSESRRYVLPQIEPGEPPIPLHYCCSLSEKWIADLKSSTAALVSPYKPRIKAYKQIMKASEPRTRINASNCRSHFPHAKTSAKISPRQEKQPQITRHQLKPTSQTSKLSTTRL